MRTWTCWTCGQQVFFDNTRCVRCSSGLAFDWSTRDVVTVDDTAVVRCLNAPRIGCTGRVEGPFDLCAACLLTRTRPSDDDDDGLLAWAEAEAAKRWMLFGLGELGLPTDGLTFDLLSSRYAPVTTGHADGLVTLDLAEADDAHREELREQMGEPYRTLLGHFRHEVGHWYFTVLVGDGDALPRARQLFGDESADYQAALDRHYASGPPLDWAERHVSAYATMHPAEDWAETFAHYLHLRDTLQTAAAHRLGGAGGASFADLLAAWLPLTVALNEVNRSMGRPDLYPFVLPPPVVEKLTFVHDLVTAAGTPGGSGASGP